MSSDENNENHFSSIQEDGYWGLVEDYREELEQFYEKKQQFKTEYSLLLIVSSLMGAFLLLSTDVLSTASELEVLAPSLAGVFAVLAFGAALGIARWALFDLVSTINALR